MIKNMNTNLFGAINVTRAILPAFRKKKAGIVVWNSSCGGWQGEVGGSPYCATKFAMEGKLSATTLDRYQITDGCASGVVECIQKETAFFGIQHILIEPGLYRTKVYSQPNLVYEDLRVSDYAAMHSALQAGVAAADGNQPGDPAKAAERIVDVVRKEGMAAGKEMPFRLPLGRDSMEKVRNKCVKTLKIIEEWEDLITSTDFATK